MAKYVEGCDLCQRHKNQAEAPVGKLMPNSILEKPWRHISADFIVKLPLAQGYNAILVVCDCLTKIAHFIPTTEKTLVAGLARLFRDNVWKLHGCQEANSKLELSQLLFISVRQRELTRVLTLLVCLLIHNLLGLCASYPVLPTKLCVTHVTRHVM